MARAGRLPALVRRGNGANPALCVTAYERILLGPPSRSRLRRDGGRNENLPPGSLTAVL
jgi:hypothetical protein